MRYHRYLERRVAMRRAKMRAQDKIRRSKGIRLCHGAAIAANIASTAAAIGAINGDIYAPLPIKVARQATAHIDSIKAMIRQIERSHEARADLWYHQHEHRPKPETEKVTVSISGESDPAAFGKSVVEQINKSMGERQ